MTAITMDHEEAQYLNFSEGNGVNEALDNDAVAIDWKKWDAILVYPIVATLFFSVLGLGTNITNIIVFIKMGLQETTTISMLALAVSDLLCCLLSLWTYMCYLPVFRDLPSLPFEPSEISSETGVNVRAYLTRTGALITAFITLERCLCVVVPMKVKNIITVPVTRISMVTIYAITVLPCIAHTFQVKLDWKFYPHLNRTRLGAVYLNNPIVSAVILVNSYVCGFFYLLFASIVIFVCTLFLGITLTRSSRWRESVRKPTQTSSVKSADQKTSGSRKEVRLIKMVVAIATLFIICHIPGMIVIFITAVTPEYLQIIRYRPSTILLQGLIFALETINNSVNFFIYFAIGTKFRRVFSETLGLKEKHADS